MTATASAPGAALTVEKIAPELLGMIVRVASLIPYPRNPNAGDVDGIGESLDEFSQYTPVVVQASTRYIVKGNHTWKAAKARGWRYLAANVMELSDAQAMAIVVGDNRHSEQSRRDPDTLAELLGELQDTSLLLGTGYSDGEVDALLAAVAGDGAGEHVEFTAYDESIADGLVLKARWIVDFPPDGVDAVRAALEALRADVPGLAWKETTAV